jgi:hypothetical protein
MVRTSILGDGAKHGLLVIAVLAHAPFASLVTGGLGCGLVIS